MVRDEVWRDPTGAVTVNEARTSCDNGLLFSVAYWLILPDKTQADMDWLARIFQRHELGVSMARYVRRVGDVVPTAHDDTLAVAVASPARAEAMLEYGRDHAWVWGPDPEHWFGRLPIFPPAIELLATGDCGYIGKLMLAGCYLVNSLKCRKSDNSRLLLYVAHQGIRGKSRLVDAALAVWRAAVGPPGKIFTDYFNQPGNPLGAPENVPKAW